jgi:hypothetical protein
MRADAARRIWFFNRTSIPSSLSKSATSLDTSTLGLPVANFTSPGCDVPKFFSPQQLIFGAPSLLPFRAHN